MDEHQDQPRKRSGISRREFVSGAVKLGVAVGVSSSLLSACGKPAPGPAGGGGAATATAGFDWKKYKGQSIRIFINKNANGEMLMKYLSEFQELTGIKVAAEALPEDQFRQKSVVELAAGTGSVDGFMTLEGQDGLKFLKSGWYAPLEPLIKNPDLTAPEWDFNDFTQASMDTQKVQGTIVGSPIALDAEILFMNKELAAAKGVQPPKTLDDLEKAAKALTDKASGKYGYVARGKRAAAVSMFCSFLYNMGGKWQNPDGSPALASPQSVEAFKFYGHLMKDYGPPGVANFGFPEVNSAFMEGNVGFATDAASFSAFYEDPAKSKVVGKVGYYPFPTGPGGDHPILYGWGVSVAQQSKKKEAMWLFAQWATNKQNAVRSVQSGAASARKSAWDNPEITSKMKPDLLAAYKHTVEVGNPNWVPLVIPVAEVRDIIGDVILTAIEGGDVKTAAEKANRLFVEAVQKSG